MVNNVVPVKKGRPPNALIESKKKRNSVGRPKGDAALMQDMKARLLASPKSRKVIDSIFAAALDDEHKGQQAAWSLLINRLLPVSLFEKGAAGGTRPSVNITISGVGGPVSVDATPIDAEYEEVNGDVDE